MATIKWIGGNSGNENTYNTAANWSGGSAPTTNDTVVIPRDAAYDIDGYDASATTLTAFIVEEGCSVNIGSTTTPLQVSPASFRYDGSGTTAVFNFNGTNTDVLCGKTVTPATGRNGLYIKGSSLDSITVYGTGNVGLAVLAGDTATVDSGADLTVSGSGVLDIGESVTLTGTTIKQNGGTVNCRSAIITLEKRGGTFNHLKGNATTVSNWGGVYNDQSNGTMTTYNGGNTGQYLREKDLRDKTITNTNLYGGTTFKDPNKTITFTNAIQFVQCSDNDCTTDFGSNIKFTPVAI